MRTLISRRPQALLLTMLAVLTAVLACNLPTSSQKGKSLTQEEALQLVLDEIVHPDQLGEDPLIVFGWPEALTPGDALHPYNIYGEDPIPGLVTVRANSWFFWIEDEPLAGFRHQTRYVLVDIKSGELSVSDQEWWPVLNDQGLWTDDKEYQNEENWVWSNVSFKDNQSNSSKSSSHMLAALLPPRWEHLQAESGNRKALVINTISEEERGEDYAVADVKHMLGFLDYYDFESTYYGTEYDKNSRRIKNPFTQGRAPDHWRVWLRTQAEVMNPGDTLIVYITGHGDGNFVVGKDGIIPRKFLRDELKKFKPCVDIIVIISACNSGSFVEELKDVADLTMTSADDSSSSYFDMDFLGVIFGGLFAIDLNPLDEGGEYTSSFIAGWKGILEDPAKKEKVNQRVKVENITFMQALCSESYSEGKLYDMGIRFLSNPQTSYGSEKSHCEEGSGVSLPDPTPTPTITPSPTPEPTPTPEDTEGTCAVFEDFEIDNTIMRHMRNCDPTLNFYYKLDSPVPGLATESPSPWDYSVLVNGKEGNCFLEEGFYDRLYCRVDISAEEANTLGHFELFANPCQEPISVLDLTIPELEGCEEPYIEPEEPCPDS